MMLVGGDALASLSVTRVDDAFKLVTTVLSLEDASTRVDFKTHLVPVLRLLGDDDVAKLIAKFEGDTEAISLILELNRRALTPTPKTRRGFFLG